MEVAPDYLEPFMAQTNLADLANTKRVAAQNYVDTSADAEFSTSSVQDAGGRACSGGLTYLLDLFAAFPADFMQHGREDLTHEEREPF